MNTTANEIRCGTLEEPAFAKINLFLEILGRRENGYHDIDTVMQTVSLSDRVRISVKASDTTEITLKSSAKWLPCDRKNTAYLAAEKLLSAAGVTAYVSIHIQKRIPTAAGLGGGSADAGAVLRALNHLLKHRFSEKQLCDIAADIGADVPFCTVGGCIRCEGIGEIFTPAPPIPPCALVIAIGAQRSPTPAAYGLLDSNLYKGTLSALPLLEAMKAGSLPDMAKEAYNAFETVILPRNTDASRIRQILTESGAAPAMMSGSGASVFGIFTSKTTAKEVVKRLRCEGFHAWYASPIHHIAL